MERLQEFISAVTAAKLAGYNPDYVSSLIRSGKIHGRKVGRNWVTTREELNHYLQSVGAKPIPFSRILGQTFTPPTTKSRRWGIRITKRLIAVAVIVAGVLAFASYDVYSAIESNARAEAQAEMQKSDTAAVANIVTSLPQI